jgi:hypothetical protein
MSAFGGKADIDAHFATRVDRSAIVASGPWGQAALAKPVLKTYSLIIDTSGSNVRGCSVGLSGWIGGAQFNRLRSTTKSRKHSMGIEYRHSLVEYLVRKEMTTLPSVE